VNLSGFLDNWFSVARKRKKFREKLVNFSDFSRKNWPKKPILWPILMFELYFKLFFQETASYMIKNNISFQNIPFLFKM